MPVLVSDIVSRCINELSQVPGIGTQIYSAGRLQQFVENAWSMEINEMWWPNYMYYQQVALDGTTGALIDDLKGPISYIDDYSDIAAVYAGTRSRKLREFPQSLNPYVMKTAQNAWYLMPDYTVPHRPFKVYPLTSTGNVVVWARQHHNTPFSMTDKLLLDDLLLLYDACWMYAVDDGTVPAQVQKYQMLAQKRRQQLKSAFAQNALELDPRFPNIADEQGWFILDQDPLA